MFWALVMTITTGGQNAEYVIDRAPTASACFAMMQGTRNRALYRNVARVSFACEKTRVTHK